MSDDLFGSTADAKADRDAALKRVRDHGGNWRDRALIALKLIPGFEGTAEDIRIRLTMKGLAAPHHHNAWGEMIKAALKAKLILPTGQRRHMKGTKSHARKSDVYIVRS